MARLVSMDAARIPEIVMAEDMITRAACAISGAPFATKSSQRKARAALSAALDPEDEAMVEIGAIALWKVASFPMPGIEPKTWAKFCADSPFDADLIRGYSIAYLAALKSHAQGQGHE